MRASKRTFFEKVLFYRKIVLLVRKSFRGSKLGNAKVDFLFRSLVHVVEESWNQVHSWVFEASEAIVGLRAKEISLVY